MYGAPYEDDDYMFARVEYVSTPAYGTPEYYGEEDSLDHADSYEPYSNRKHSWPDEEAEGGVWTGPKSYEVHDSGKKANYGDGMRRDTADGKPRFDLIFPDSVPYEEQLLTRVAMQYYRGGQKYGDRNWEKSSTRESLDHHEAALMRHVIKFLTGTEDGEDHGAAIVWNVNAVDLTRRNMKRKQEIDEALDYDQRIHSFKTHDRPEVWLNPWEPDENGNPKFRRYNPATGEYED